MSDVLIKCFKCGKSYPTSDMRFKSSSNNDLICKYCLNKSPPPTVHSEVKQTIMPQVKNTGYNLPKKPTAQSATSEKMNEYKCSKCSYSFKRKSSVDVSKCPYCGSEKDLQMKTAKSADSLINDSTRYG